MAREYGGRLYAEHLGSIERARLKAEQRAARDARIVKLLLDGMTQAEVARSMGIHTATVKQALTRASQRP